MRNVRQSANEAQTRHPPWAISRGARHWFAWSFSTRPLPVGSPHRDRRKRISRCNHLSGWICIIERTALKRCARELASWKQVQRTSRARGRAPSSRASRLTSGATWPHPGPRAPCNPPLVRSEERAPFFFDTDYCADRAYPMRNGTI